MFIIILLYYNYYRGYNVLVRPFYEKIVLFQVLGFKPDLNESIAMMEKSNKRKFIYINVWHCACESCITTII